MSSENVLHVTDDSFDRDVIQADGPVLVDFWAEWCAPCRMLGPTIDQLADEYAGRVKIAKVDVDTNHQVAARLGISSIPTVILFDRGDAVRRWVGVSPKQAYAEALEEIVTQHA